MKKTNFLRHISQEHKDALIFLAPLIVVLALFVLLPVVGTIINSFFQDVTFLERSWIFLDNYKKLIVDNGFWQAVRFNLLFVAISVPFELLLGFIFALILNETIPFRGMMRAAVLIPWAIPAAISARVWELIYNFSYGLANYVILQLGINTDPINWLGTTAGAFCALVIADAWKMAPFISIILLAGLSAIPDDIYKQAKIDGTNFIQRFYFITLPILKPVIMVALLFRTIDALRVFDVIFVLTNGGPGGSTNSLSLYGYKFFIAGDFGYGSTVSVALFIITFILSTIYIHIGNFRRRSV